MKQKYVMPELEEMKKDFKNFIKRMKEYENGRIKRLSEATKS